MTCAAPRPRAIAAPATPHGRRPGRPADVPPLSAEQERELGRAVAAGDRDARDRLARANLGLVVTIARRFLGHGLDLDDLVGEGNVGLMRAAAGFDPDFGVRFSTYAGYWIREAIGRALSDTASTIRVPSYMVRRLREFRRAERAMMREGAASPSVDGVADRMGLTGGQRAMLGQALRARRPAGGGGDREGGPGAVDELGDPGESPSARMERAEGARALRRRMAERLTERERRVLEMRFGLGDGDPLTFREVAERLGCTREWARKVESRAVAKLRD